MRPTPSPFVAAAILAIVAFASACTSGSVDTQGSSEEIDSALRAVHDRMRAAERVFVGTVTAVTARWEITSFGDHIIVSRADFDIDEAIKGPVDDDWLPIEVRGGTIGELTLTVSHVPLLHRTQRAIVFANPVRGDAYALVGEEEGFVELDVTNQVRGSHLKLDDFRRLAHR